MKNQPVLEMSDVDCILQAARTEALKNQWAVCIAVVDAGGHLMGFTRLDGSAPLSTYISQEKARTSAMGKRESRIYEELINQGRYSFLSAPHVQGMLEGGVPIVREGVCLGAVGVSGVKSIEDAQIAKAGIAAWEASL